MALDSDRVREAKFNLFCRWVAEQASKAMRDPEFMKGFYEWHLKTYGEPYVPERVCLNESTEESSDSDLV